MLQVNHGCGSLLARLDPRLMVCVNVDKRGIKTHCSLEKRNQKANRKWRNCPLRYRDGFDDRFHTKGLPRPE